ncbi:MAG: zinc-dependent metalloprotease family protein, partial [Pseudolysinimonas sp.]
FRLSALLAAIAVIAASVLPAFPAVADDAPTPDPTPVVEPVETPTPDPTPVVDPPVVEPVETPTPDPTPVVEPVETPTPEPTTAPAGTVKYSGTVQEFANDGIDVADGTVLFSVNGQGYLRADISGLTPRPDALNPVSLTLTVPAGLTLSGDADARFTQLAAASTESALVAVSSAKIKQTAPRETGALVNQTPNTSAIHHIFAVYVSPSNKKVKDAGQVNSTAAQALVDYADTYWNTQSSGSIHFTLDHVVPWYQSTYSCKTNAGSTSLWNQALVKAKTAGFVPGKNNHLVLIMPNGGPAYSYCGGAIGLAGVGGSVNQGGVVWVMGNTDPIAKETIAHELGHNMSLGHADWLACTSSNPSVGVANTNYSPPGIAGCTVNNYGDTTDVMGFGIGDGLSGALSSPQAIRAGIWPSSKWTTAPIGSNQTFTLLPVADHSGAAGAHAVVVQDTDGTAYFVELRNFQNEDATNYIGCNSQACTLNLPNVRILRFEPSGYSGYPGADTYLIGRSNTNVGYTAASIPFTMPSGDSIQVTAVSSTSATIKVTRVTPGTATTEFDDWVNLTRTIGYDGSLRVGDTMSLFLGDYWNQETYTFAWYRNGVTIAGATGQNYTLTALDLGTKINASVTPLGQAAVYDYADNTPVPVGGYGPIAPGVYQASDPGTITVNNAATPLQAVTAAWPSGTTFAYQWYRGKTLTTATTAATGSGAATASYTPNTADYDQYLRVRVTASVPGYNPVARYSVASNFSIFSPSTLAIAGTPKVGTQVTVDTTGLAFFDVGGVTIPSAGVTLTYQWLRNGIPITDTFATTIDATDDTDYTLRSLDYGAKLTLRVTASKPGLVAKVITSATFTTTIKGTIQASSPASSIANVFDAAAPAKVTLTASTSGVTEPELSTAGYQWYRVNLTTGVPTAIAGATAAIYKPTAADFPYKLRVVVTVKKTNYDSLPLPSADRDFSVRIDPSTPLGFFGGSVFTFASPAASVTGNVPSWNVELTPGSYATISFGTPSFDTFYQWRRTGVSLGVPGNAWSYGLVAADVGKSLSYTVKADYPGYISYSAVSPNSPLIAAGTFAHNQDVSITSVGNTKTAHAATTDVTPNVTLADISYQWTRDGVAIAGATTANYTVSQAADYGKTIKVRVSYETAGYTTYPQLGVDGTGQYWIKANSVLPVITGIQGIGSTLSVAPRTYVDMNTGSTINSGIQSSYQWYRSGVAIAGPLGTNSTYDLIGLDKGKTITVKVTVAATGVDYDLPSIATSAATPAIGVSALPGTAAADPVLIVQAESTPFVTVLAPTSTGITSPNATPNTVTYQWYRDGAAITGGTKVKYTLTQTDRGHLIKVRITTSHAAILTTTYTTDVRYSNAVDYTLVAASGADVHIYTDLSTGADLAPVTPTYTDANSNVLTGVSQTYQWYRKVGTKTTAITGATNLFYNPQAADVGASLSVRVTTGLQNYIPYIVTYTTTPATLKVIKGTLLNTAPLPVVTVSVPATNTLLAMPPVVTGAILFPASLTQHATFTYKWLRNGVAITGATASTYKLVAADTGKNINVLVTAKLAGYNSVTLSPSTPLNYSITLDLNPSHIPYMSTGTFSIGSQVVVYSYADFATKDGALVSPTVAFQWLRAGVAIPGATADNYALGLADYNKAVNVRLTVSQPGYLPLVFLIPTQLVGKGITLGLAAGYADASVAVIAGPGLGTLVAPVSDVYPTTPVPTYKYVWYRNGVAIAAPLGTAATYKLVAADAGKSISVKVTMTRVNFVVPVTVFGPTTPINYTITSDGTKPTIDTSGGTTVGLSVVA